MFRAVRIKDQHLEQRLFVRRALGAAGCMLLAFSLIISRLIWLQVARYDYFVELSQGNRIKVEPIPPNRGLILDRNGVTLATNTPSYQLELTREQVPDLDATLAALGEIGMVEREDIPRLRREIRSRRAFDAVPVRLQLGDTELARFAARRHEFPGVDIKPRLTRYYPFGPSSVHAIGYVGAISEEDKSELPADYLGTALIGKSGVEKAYEAVLHGSAGTEQLMVNAQGRRVVGTGRVATDLVRREPIAGNDLFLTIDQRVQQAAEESLRGRRAAIVAIDPASGDVLAFVSTPAFDPNLFAKGLSRTQYLALTEDPQRPMYDRALRGVYPPGSTVKPLMAMAALESDVVHSDNTRYCRGKWSAPGYGRERRDWQPKGHGTVDMRRAIATSCDIYFYDIARLMGIDRMAGMLGQFGLGAVTGIDIPGERRGILPSSAWKRAAFKRKEMQVWFPGDTISVGIGQGQMQVTPLQLAHAIATLAARGKRYQPRMVKAMRDVQTGKVSEIAPVALPPVVPADPGGWDVAIGGMIDVVNAPHGTARNALAAMGPSPFLMAGKSGTAQVFSVAANERMRKAPELQERLRDHALFVAFAPADAPMPKIAVAVVLENGVAGGRVAGPIARKVLESYLLPAEEFAALEAKRAADAAKKAAAIAPGAAPAEEPTGRE